MYALMYVCIELKLISAIRAIDFPSAIDSKQPQLAVADLSRSWYPRALSPSRQNVSRGIHVQIIPTSGPKECARPYIHVCVYACVCVYV